MRAERRRLWGNGSYQDYENCGRRLLQRFRWPMLGAGCMQMTRKERDAVLKAWGEAEMAALRAAAEIRIGPERTARIFDTVTWPKGHHERTPENTCKPTTSHPRGECRECGRLRDRRYRESPTGSNHRQVYQRAYRLLSDKAIDAEIDRNAKRRKGRAGEIRTAGPARF